ncbi:MAG TPA: SHOCT domain-containing protein [Opitutaceae bacterium]|nr:SHOCT domain-containing protein [Opitutaceae bacterium]
MKTTAIGLLVIALLAGCMTADRLNDIRIGMTKDQVISLLGKPDSTSAQGNIEYLTYYLITETRYGRDAPYSIRMVDGKVESFGRFAQLTDIYMRPVGGGTPQINLGLPVATVAPAAESDLVAQLQKLKALKDQGALTDEEFQKAKEKLLSQQK